MIREVWIYGMVGRCRLTWHLSISLNNHGDGGRVPPKREGMESGYNSWVSCSRHHCGAGSLDVHERYKIVHIS